MESKARPCAWRIPDGEGDYDYRTTRPSVSDVGLAFSMGLVWEPLYDHAPAPVWQD